LLFLCEEGQLDKALERVRKWDEQDNDHGSNLKKSGNNKNKRSKKMIMKQELFRKNVHTGNYCLHEILAGGICGTSTPELVDWLLKRYNSEEYRNKARDTIFKAQPKDSHGRTVLHWCAWSKVPMYVLKQVIVANPECMLLRDHSSHGSRTPYDISKRYWGINDPNTMILKSSLDLYLPYRIQYNVHLCINRIFNLSVTATPTTEVRNDNNCDNMVQEGNIVLVEPFREKDRKSMKIRPKPWFVASVIGYTKQRQMDHIANHIVSYIGYKSKAVENKEKKNMKRKKQCQ